MGSFFLNRISRKGKRQKRYSSSSSSHNNSNLFDRLPDEILVHILSFMSTRDCVQSSTLAKRWRLLWAHVPNLKFHSGDHKKVWSFIDFFNRFVFVHKGHNINTLRIAYGDDDDMDGSEYKSEIETLIATAIECNVQVIDIVYDFELVLPQCLFTCKTLVDRVPDDILVHILSLLPTRECVGSSILATRWRLLWARVPNLKFDSRDHKTLSSFFLVNRFVFEHKGRNINTFRIEYDEEDSEYKSEIETLIVSAIECNVQVIEIRSGFELVLPQCLFTCKTLVDLTLINRIRVSNFPMTGTSSVVCLPALKKLQLIMVRYESKESLEHLLSGCPALEELTIRKAADDVVRLHISSPTLTRLNLEIDYGNEDYIDEVKLDTPALEYLWLEDAFSRDFSAGMLASLTEADVDFDALHSDALYSRSILEFVCKLNNVSRLKLRTSWNWVEAPDSAFSALTTTEFRNLTKLELAGELGGDWRLVTYFLENSDNLQVLIINMVNDFQNWMEPKRVPMCLKYHLREVRFEDFECLEEEFNTVEYILRNAKVLKTMKIHVSHWNNDLKKKSLMRTSLFERASEACQLAFDWES